MITAVHFSQVKLWPNHSGIKTQKMMTWQKRPALHCRNRHRDSCIHHSSTENFIYRQAWAEITPTSVTSCRRTQVWLCTLMKTINIFSSDLLVTRAYL